MGAHSQNEDLMNELLNGLADQEMERRERFLSFLKELEIEDERQAHQPQERHGYTVADEPEEMCGFVALLRKFSKK